MNAAEVVEKWHEVVKNSDVVLLQTLLADDVVFHSPVVHTPQEGKQRTMMYLSGAVAVLGSNGFHYVREIISENEAALEFMAEIDGITINGIDLISVNADGRITDFKVMIRPLKAVNILHQKMGEMLEKLKGG